MEKGFSLSNEINFVSIFNKIKESKTNLIIAFIISAIILIPTIIASNIYDIPYSKFMRDPVVLLKGDLYTGWFSQLGCMLWFVTAGFCFLSANLVSKDHPVPGLKSFLFYSFSLTTFLGADDIFLFHDEIFPYWGFNERVFMLVYVLIVALLILIYYKVIFKTQYILLGLAFCFLGLSMFMDSVPRIGIFRSKAWNNVLYEDGAKMIGIIFWMVYFYSVGKFALKKQHKPI